MKINGIFIRAVFYQEWWVCGFLKCFFVKTFIFVFCFNYMAPVSFHQSFQIFFSVYLTTFPFILFHSVGFTPFVFACS